MLEPLADALATVFTLQHLFYLGIGVLLGLAIGVFPGLGGIAGLSLLLPFLYGMDLVSALATLIGLVAVIPTSDTFTSVLMGIPGSSASQATVLDGFPLAKQGQAARALGAAFTASLFGGLVGAFLLTLFVQVARPVLLIFGSAELFMLALLGLSMVGSLSGRSVWKGIIACGLGLTVGSIGAAPATGEFRMVLGVDYLYDGLPLVVVALGVFAIPEIVDLIRRGRAISTDAKLGDGFAVGMRDVWRNKFLTTRCAGIGALIGAIPGMGGSVVDWIAYAHVVQTTRGETKFGKGDIRGVIAPESANNAKEGGALMPTLLFGIPGSGAMAVFLGGMVLLGIEAGPSMVTSDLNLTYTIIWSLALANVLGAGLCLFLATPIARLTTIPFGLLAPFMITVISFAAFQATRDMMDLWMLLGFGAMGVWMKRFGWSRPAFLIGFVLAPQAEAYLIMAVQFYGWSMFLRPGVITLVALTAVSIFFARRGTVEEHGGSTSSDEPRLSSPGSRAKQGWLIATGLLCFVVMSYDAQQQSFLGGIFPLAVSLSMIPFTVYLLWLNRARPEDPSVFDAEAGTLDKNLEGLDEPDQPDQQDPPSDPGAVATLSWIGLLYAGSLLLGFLGSVGVFFVAFLRLRARADWWVTAGLTAGVLGFLVIMGRLLVLEFPQGLLNELIQLNESAVILGASP